ncbi:hypothetical protein BMT54_01260 [Pasteurellaceae bacterium 15-036681]|nr:hypothetical protein BMT54_01260 [Pasteurellaceae bacterium 15-036681]
MKVKCPACGALNSLDALIAHEDASQALLSALAISGELGQKLVGYLGLFRPQKSSLSFGRVATLLNELQPMITAQRISRDGIEYPAPVEAWIAGINGVLAQRHNLRLPLNSHGYLLEIISRYQPKTVSGALAVAQNYQQEYQQQSAPTSKTVGAVSEAMKWASNG